MQTMFRRVAEAVGIKLAKPEARRAFDEFAEVLTMKKEWDTTGHSIVLRQKWYDADGTLVGEAEHNYIDDIQEKQQ